MKINRVWTTDRVLTNGNTLVVLLDLESVDAVSPYPGSGGRTTICQVKGKEIEINDGYEDFSKVWLRFKEQQS